MSAKIKAKSEKLISVRKLTDHQSKTNAKILKALFVRHAEEESKLIELIGYRKEYQDRSLQASTQSCTTIQQAQNNRRFLNEISNAIHLQQEKLVKLSGEIESVIEIWKKSHQKNKALEKLIERYRCQYAKFLNRYEQLTVDDQIMRSQYKASHMLR